MADPLETYTHIPLHLDPTTKQISALSASSLDQAALTAISNLNTLHTSLKTLETPSQIPPPPVPVNPKRSAQISKLKDAASAAHRKGNYVEAVRLWGYAIDMASGRPGWEPVGLVREELSVLFLGRGESHAGNRAWVEGWKDAERSVECKAGPAAGPQGQKGPGNVKAWVLGARCLGEMGRWGEGLGWCEKAVEVEGVSVGGVAGAGQGEDAKELLRLLGQARKEGERGGVRS
jgi:translocation protein SEC72